MFRAISRLVSSLDTPKDKDDILEEIESTSRVLDSETLPSLNNLIEFLETGDIKISDNTMLTKLAKEINFRNDSALRMMLSLRVFLEEIRDNLPEFRKLAKDDLPQYLTNDGLGVKTGAIFTLSTEFTSTTLFILDLILAITYEESTDNLSKSKRQEVLGYINAFAGVHNALKGKVKDKIKGIHKLSNTKVTADNHNFVGKISSKVDVRFELPVNNFVGNPFYHVGKWITDLMDSRHEANKDKVKLIELKIHELRMKQNGEKDDNLSKQIDYYENKLSKLEYKIRTYEE